MNSLYTSILILFAIIEFIQGCKLSNRRTEDDKYELIIRELEEKIAGGYPAKDGQYPFFVGLRTETTNKFFICSGSLITDELVLTAAHCFDKPFDKIELAASNIAADFWTPDNVEIYTNRKVCISPKFGNLDGRLYYDYAIIRLNKPMNFSDSVQPIWLPNAPIDPETEAFALGTGVVYEDSNDKEERATSLNVLPVKKVDCPLMEQKLPSEILCFNNSRPDYIGDTCGGDSGGPIVAEVDGKMRVFATLSYGNAVCEKGLNGVSKNSDIYKQIDHVLDIIRDCMS